MFLEVSQENNSQENNCVRISFWMVRNFVKKETLAWVFSCEFCEIIKSIFLQSTSGRLLLIAIITQRSQKRYVIWDKVFENGPSQIFGGQFLWFILVLSQNQKQPPEVFCKKVFLEISQNSQEITCARVSFLIPYWKTSFSV